MLQAPFRLRRAADLQQVWQQGRTWRHPLGILVARRNSLAVSRFAFVASRRVGNAVVRNRARRLMREVVRLHLVTIATGWDCVFVARTKTAYAQYGDVETAVLSLLKRAHLLEIEDRVSGV